MKKRNLAMLMGLLMVVSSLAGCGSTTGKEASTEKATSSAAAESKGTSAAQAESETEEEGIPLDYFAGVELEIAVVRTTADASNSYAEKPIVIQAEEATGIHINWIEVDAGVASERLSTLLASGDLPDALLGFCPAVTGNESLFYDLSEEGLLETYAPDVLADYELGGQGIMDMITQTDGGIYSLVTGPGSSYTSSPGAIMYIRNDWLDALGMDIPSTADEFYEVLCAFRDNDMDGDGDATNEIPMTFADSYWAGAFINLANSYGIASTGQSIDGSGFTLKDGQILSTYDTDEYRAFLEFYNKLAKEGLLDVEGFSQSTEQYNTKKNEGRVGVMLGYTPPTDENIEYVAMAPFQGLEGVEVRKSGCLNMFYANTTGLVASAKCSNIEALLWWWNYLHTETDIKYQARYGLENYYWFKDDEGYHVGSAEGYEKDPNIDERTYGLGDPQSCPYIRPDESFIPDDTTPRVQAVQAVEEYMLDIDEILISRPVDAEKKEERNFIATDLFELVKEYMANSVINGVTDASWDAYLKNLETYGYYEWLEWYQGYVDYEF